MSKLQENPQLALATLEKIAEEIPSGVSGEEVANISPRLQNLDEIIAVLNEGVSSEIKSKLREFWEAYDINKKLENLKNLKQTKSTNVDRTMSAQDELLTVKMKCLLQKQEKLMAEIEPIQKENLELQKYLEEQAELIKEQMEDCKACQELLSTFN